MRNLRIGKSRGYSEWRPIPDGLGEVADARHARTRREGLSVTAGRETRLEVFSGGRVRKVHAGTEQAMSGGDMGERRDHEPMITEGCIWCRKGRRQTSLDPPMPLKIITIRYTVNAEVYARTNKIMKIQ